MKVIHRFSMLINYSDIICLVGVVVNIGVTDRSGAEHISKQGPVVQN